MERSIGLAFTTLLISAPLARAAPPEQAVKPEGIASEYADRACGVNGSICRQRQSSVALLTERLGARGGGRADQDPAGSAGSRDNPGGCMAAGGLPSSATALALLGVLRRRRRR